MICLLSWFISIFVLGSSSKLNVPRVLLSYNYEQPSNFTLSVFDGGCYDWRSTRSSEVLVVPVQADNRNCATEAVVSAVTRSPTRQTAIILAKDSVSGVTLRCDVIIDSFSRLEIVTTTRELYVEEAPEEFEVRAYDSQGNEFSSLNGLQFEWQLENVARLHSAVPAQAVLRFMRFTDSPYTTPPEIAPLEHAGLQGSRVLIEGRQTGVARLKVSLPHSAYDGLPPSAVTLMVVANLLLEPQDVYVLPDTHVLYAMLHLKHGLLHPVPLQPSHYYLQVEDDSVAELQPDGVTVRSLALGQTVVVLHDRNVKTSSSSIKQPSANYHVVEPGYLTIELAPGNRPSLVVGRSAAFHVHVYDKLNNRVLLSDLIAVRTIIPKEYFTTEDLRPNGTYAYGTPRKDGKMTVTATLHQYTVGGAAVMLSPPLAASLDVSIFAPLSVTPNLTLLPWDAVTQPQHSVQLTVTGGSGHVTWLSNASQLAGVDSGGHVTTRGVGAASITAAMTQNTDNRDTARVVVQEVGELILVEGWREAAEGETLGLDLAAFTGDQGALGERRVFTACHMLPFVVSRLSSDFVASPDVRPGEEDGACATVDITGQQPGFSSVQVGYSLQSGDEMTIHTTVGAYRPLQVTVPDRRAITVLAPSTGRLLQFTGGPLPWIHRPAGHYVRVSVDSPEVVSAQLMRGGSKDSEGDSYAVFVECERLGEAVLTLTVGNEPSSTLPRPRQNTASTTIVCGAPEALQLSLFTVPKDCPLHQHTTGIAACDGPVPLSVTVTDGAGRRLYNTSALRFRWSADGGEDLLTALPGDDRLERDGDTEYGMLQPAGRAGEVSVTVSLVSTSITALLRLRLVQHATLHPATLALHSHPDSAGRLSIMGGSGYFLLQDPAGDDTVALVQLDAPGAVVSVKAVGVGTRSVTVTDLCVSPSRSAVAEVRVGTPGAVAVTLPRLVREGGSVTAVLQLLDAAGLPLPLQEGIMTVTLTPQDDLVSADLLRFTPSGEAEYRVTGRRVGDTSVRGSVAIEGKLKRSDASPRLFSFPQPLQVYPPLRLKPRRLVLMVGATFQVTASGGPYPDCVVEFVSSNGSVCGVGGESGLVTAAGVGETEVRARAVLSDEGGRRVLLQAEDVVIVRVVRLAAIEVTAPTTHMEAGVAAPLHVTGRAAAANNGSEPVTVTPLGYASAEPALIIRWTSSDERVATITDLLDENRVSAGSVNRGSVRVLARRAGRTRITVVVEGESTAGQLVGGAMTASLMLQVFPPLSLLSPRTPAARLLLAPGAVYRLHTNREAESNMSYSIESSCSMTLNVTRSSSTDSPSNATSDGGPVVSVSSSGVLRAASRVGEATLLVSAKEQFGVTQRAAVLVEVREVRYLLASVSRVLSIADNGSVTGVPLGASLPLLLSYHDDTGRTFDAVTAGDTSVIANRHDLLLQVIPHSSNSSAVTAVVRGAGQTVLELRHRSLAHYIRVPTQPAVHPYQACVSVGAPLCFSTSVRGPREEAGRWSSDGPLLSVTPEGEGVALTPGRAGITYSVGDQLTIRGEVVVQPVRKLLLSAPSGLHLSDGTLGETVTVILTATPACEEGEARPPPCTPATLASDAWLRTVTCVLELRGAADEAREVWAAEAVYGDQGYACAVRTLAERVSWLRTAATLPSVLLYAVTESESGRAVRSSPVTLPVLPSVAVNASEVVLNNLSPHHDNLVVTGPVTALQQLMVRSNTSVVEVVLGAVLGSGWGQRRLEVWGQEEAWGGEGGTSTPALLTITSPLTRQAITVSVLLQQVGDGSCAHPRRPPASLSLPALLLSLLAHYQTHLFTALCVALTAASLAVGYQAVCGPRYRHTQQTGVFASTPAPPPPPTSPTPSAASSFLTSGPASPNISLWSSDSVYGVTRSPPPLTRPSPRRL